jgi:hypothetical protein
MIWTLPSSAPTEMHPERSLHATYHRAALHGKPLAKQAGICQKSPTWTEKHHAWVSTPGKWLGDILVASDGCQGLPTQLLAVAQQLERQHSAEHAIDSFQAELMSSVRTHKMHACGHQPFGLPTPMPWVSGCSLSLNSRGQTSHSSA